MIEKFRKYTGVAYDTILDVWFLCGEFVAQLKTKLIVARLRRIGKDMRKGCPDGG